MKQKPNEKCNCGSTRKYKKCCMNKEAVDYSFQKSSKLWEISRLVQSQFNIKCINLTMYLDQDTYAQFQKYYITQEIVMLAERNPVNEQVFVSRTSNTFEDVILMYHGAYLIFNSNDLDLLHKSISRFINTF
jgi:endonuclease IV